MECFKQKCLGGSLCEVAGCVLKYPLAKGRELKIIRKCGSLTGKDLDKKIIELFYHYDPPKVSEKTIDGYYYWLRRGYNLDRRGVPPNQNKPLSKAEHKKKRTKKRARLSVRDMMADVHLSVNTNTPRQTREEKLFLQAQTVEELKLIQKHGPVVGRQLAAPEPNFHCE